MKFCHEILETLGYQTVNTKVSVSTCFETVLGCDRRTELP